MQFVESMLMKHLCLYLCPRLLFPSKKMFSQKMFLELVEKIKLLYVLLVLTKFNFATSFDL